MAVGGFRSLGVDGGEIGATGRGRGQWPDATQTYPIHHHAHVPADSQKNMRAAATGSFSIVRVGRSQQSVLVVFACTRNVPRSEGRQSGICVLVQGAGSGIGGGARARFGTGVTFRVILVIHTVPLKWYILPVLHSMDGGAQMKCLVGSSRTRSLLSQEVLRFLIVAIELRDRVR